MGTPPADFNKKRVVENGIGCDDGAAGWRLGKIFDVLALNFVRNIGYGFKRAEGAIRMV
jgi:hypothetical protein